MSVTSQVPYIRYTAAAASTVFPTSFRVILATDLVVKVNGVVVGSGFVLSGLDTSPTVNVTFTVPRAGGEIIELYRDVPLTRSTDYQFEGDFLSPVVNKDFDRLWQAMQDKNYSFNQAMRVPFGETLTILPAAALRLGKMPVFNLTTGDIDLSTFTYSQVANAVAAAYAAGSTADAVTFLQAGAGAVSRTVQNKERDTVSVQDFGAVGDGVANDYAAFAAAWAYIKPRGGSILIPPGNYLLNTRWLCDVDATLPHNYEIIGYGATLFAGAAVTTAAIEVSGGYNNFGVKIEGLAFNHRNNTTVGGCIKLTTTTNARIVKCSVEHHNTKAAYSGIEVGTLSFWTTIDGFTTRQRVGGDGTDAAVGIRLTGQTNATRIYNCSFTSVVDAIRLGVDGALAPLNSLRVRDNDFEGVTNCITVDGTGPATGMPVGVLVSGNRVELATTFFNITGPAVPNPGYPPILENNYLTVGSVTNYLVNPNSQFIFTSEPSYFGVGARNFTGAPADYRIVTEGAGKNVVLADLSGNSTWSNNHLVFGATHVWADSATNRIFLKTSAPASGQDGAMVGSISGTATFAAGTAVVVTIGVTMAAATYKVALGPSANKTFWVSGKTTTQFTLNASSASSDAVDWQVTV
jgi:hypothetical protein